jgi:hypothetical protein
MWSKFDPGHFMIGRLFRKLFLSIAVVISVAIVFAVCWHSLKEIHYLKSFFPESFAVEEAFYASTVELVKVIIISLSFVLVILVSLYLLGAVKKEDQ